MSCVFVKNEAVITFVLSEIDKKQLWTCSVTLLKLVKNGKSKKKVITNLILHHLNKLSKHYLKKISYFFLTTSFSRLSFSLYR